MLAREGAPIQRRIAALQGASTSTIQNVLAGFADRLMGQAIRVAGVVEINGCDGESGCKHLSVRDLASGAVFAITQDLGAGSTACSLDPGGLAKACGMVESAISDGADVVVLSKFGKLEAARSGLCDAFRAAIMADLPIITAVSPILANDWSLFAGPLFDYVAARTDALDDWWRTHGRRNVGA
jgi:hypothetical protein